MSDGPFDLHPYAERPELFGPMPGFDPGAPAKIDYEIIVVDIGSSDGTAEWLAEAWPQVRLIRLEGNQDLPSP